MLFVFKYFQYIKEVNRHIMKTHTEDMTTQVQIFKK